MKIILLCLVLATSSCVSKAQKWSPEQLSAANTAADANYLNQEEKNMVFYLNLIRTDGSLFFNTYFKEYVERTNIEMRKYSNYNDVRIDKKSKYYRSLEEDLKKIKGLKILLPHEKLSRVSAAHAVDLGKTNRVSHDSSNGKTFAQRISSAFPNHAAAENLAFGSMTGLDIMCALLLDQNVTGLGHRKNILNSTSNFTHIGVSIKPHPTYRLTGVMDFLSVPEKINL
ncbi:MAG: CAP domain-containing protein [Pedobacter sp.]|nr:MAG: CAP domain-containing protein [Pedobacter sp.]